MKKLRKFLEDESGASSIEYGLLAALIAISLVSGLTIMRYSIQGKIETAGAAIATINYGAP